MKTPIFNKENVRKLEKQRFNGGQLKSGHENPKNIFVIDLIFIKYA